MYETNEKLLTHLESCPKTWAVYIRHQVRHIQDHILALRRWADLKPGNVADVLNAKADKLGARVTQLLDSLPGS